jgi:hypothetical protein
VDTGKTFTSRLTSRSAGKVRPFQERLGLILSHPISTWLSRPMCGSLIRASPCFSFPAPHASTPELAPRLYRSSVTDLVVTRNHEYIILFVSLQSHSNDAPQAHKPARGLGRLQATGFSSTTESISRILALQRQST